MLFMKTLPNPVSSRLDIKKSTFIGAVEPIASHEEGLAKVSALRAQHPDATHVCFTMLVNGQVRQSDDGEPSGTAAAPMLNVLQHKELDHVLATVARYYGGVKLGAGGLVRAYSQAISDALQGVSLTTVRALVHQRLRTEFEYESLLRRMAQTQDVSLDVQYETSGILVELCAEQEKLDSLIQQFSEQTRGRLWCVP